MVHTPKPILYVSSCLEHDHCRYDGQMIRSDAVASLKNLCEMHHACPEVGIGLGVPRRPVRIVLNDGERNLWQPATGQDHTEAMNKYIGSLLNGLGDVDGFILKSRSPTCAVGDSKVYPARDSVQALERDGGFLGKEVLANYPFSAVEDESRLINDAIRDHFLTCLYTTARFRRVREEGSASSLIRFHTVNKILLMAYSQSRLADMGNIVSHQKDLGISEAIFQYRVLLAKALSKGPRFTSAINAIMHCFGYVSKDLSGSEKEFFLDNVQMFREERTPFTTLRELIRSYIIRSDIGYLKDQTFFDPYPIELVRSCGPDRDRDYWK